MKADEIYSVLVLEMGISPAYALDRMEIYEMTALFRHRHLRHRESWEQSRMTAFIVAKCGGSKISEPKELFSLPWDNEDENVYTENKMATEDDCRRLEATARYLLENGMMG